MSRKIDPREVLTYLNELGYTNINAQQLKDFITDLKKLIKYESRRAQKENLETVASLNSATANPCHCPYVETSKQNEEDVYSHLYSQHTVASRAKEAPRKEKHISVHIKKPKNKLEVHEHCTHFQKRLEDEEQQKGDLQLIQNVETVSDGSNLYVNTESTIKSIDAASKQSVSTKPSTTKKKSKCSFIKSTSAKSINKSDPVALYHYYQDQWKKQKFPGQENHADLRWSVREKMLGGPRVEINPPVSTFRKRCNTWRG